MRFGPIQFILSGRMLAPQLKHFSGTCGSRIVCLFAPTTASSGDCLQSDCLLRLPVLGPHPILSFIPLLCSFVWCSLVCLYCERWGELIGDLFGGCHRTARMPPTTPRKSPMPMPLIPPIMLAAEKIIITTPQAPCSIGRLFNIREASMTPAPNTSPEKPIT